MNAFTDCLATAGLRASSTFPANVESDERNARPHHEPRFRSAAILAAAGWNGARRFVVERFCRVEAAAARMAALRFRGRTSAFSDLDGRPFTLCYPPEISRNRLRWVARVFAFGFRVSDLSLKAFSVGNRQ